MTPTRTNPLIRLMPSLTDVAFLLPVLFLFAGLQGAVTMLGDGDTGYHIRAGEWMLANGRVPTEDMFSFTKPAEPWFAWEWLWDVSFAWLHQHGGLAAVVLVNILIICFATALLYRMTYRRCGNPLVAILVTGLASGGASIHWLARPHLVTMLFLLIFIEILDQVRDGHAQMLWSLPLLTILWTNLHGGFFVGIIVIGAYAGGELIASAVAKERRDRIAKFESSLPYITAAIGCALASLVNPYGYHLHEHIVKYFQDPDQTRNIQEFMGTNFQWASSRFTEVMMVAAVCAAVWHARRKHFAEVLLIAGWAHLALIAVRNVPIFMLAAAPFVVQPLTAGIQMLAEAPVADWLRSAAENFREIGEEIGALEKTWRVHIVSVMVIVLLGLGMSSPGAGSKLKPKYDSKVYPEAALAEVAQPGSRIFTHDEWGDYLIYNLWPKGIRVFVDGRSDFYGGKFYQEYLDILNVKYNWHEQLARYGVNTILLPADYALAGAVKESSDWRVVYDDHRSIVFRSVRAENTNELSVSNTGRIGGRDREITAASNVIPRNHEISKKGAKP
jgi:hypothetical protein